MNDFYDVVVIGGGPAGLTAALYLARARYRVVVVEKEHFGGQITITHQVVNYPGVERTSGAELTETMRRQAEQFGAEFLLADVEKLDMNGDEDQLAVIYTNRGTLKAFGVLLATGAHPRTVGFVGEEVFKGRGVAYCATCDGEFFTGKEVFVVGGGYAAAEEAVFLTKYASHVTILIREEDFSCARSVAEAARRHPKITVLTNREVVEVSGDSVLRSIRFRHKPTGEVTERKAANGDAIGVFVFVGYAPATELVKGLAQVNEQGYVVTDASLRTSVEGLYAAGDVCVKPLRQVTTAVGDGALAATALEKYVSAMQEKTGLKPEFSMPEKPDRKPGTDQKSKFPAPEKSGEEGISALFDGGMLDQLNTVFSKMTAPLVLKLYLKDDNVSQELRDYMEGLVSLTEKLSLEIEAEKDPVEHLPCVRICRADGSWTGLAFHGVPGGHEFTSFVLGLYNAAGPGQALDGEVLEAVSALDRKLDLKVLVSLSCTICPELVTAAQRIAGENEKITAQVYDLNHFPQIREQYSVMSVPCLVVNDGEKISFGKKNVRQLLELLKD